MTEPGERTPLLASERANGDVQSDVPSSSGSASAIHTTDEAIDSAEQVEAAADAIKRALPKRIVIPSLIAVLSGLFIAAIDSTLIVALIGSISSSFVASDRAFWVNTAYLLSMGACSPVYGRLSDIFGRKLCLLWAVCLFGIGTLMCTMAPSMMFLIVARGVQGIGAAGLQPAAAIVINDLIPVRSRGIYQAIAQLVFSMGYALGGPVGGFLNDSFGWRFAFIIQLPPIVISLFLLSTFLKLPVLPKTAVERARVVRFEGKPLLTLLWSRLDPIGALLFISAIVSMLLSLSLLSAYDLDWSDARVYGGLLLGAALLAIFLFVEIKVVEEPLMPLRIMRQRSLACIWAIYFLMSFTGALLFYFPFFFLVILGQSSAQIGLHYLPVSVATMSASFLTGALLKRSGRYWRLAVGLSVINVASPAYLATWTDTNKPSALGQNLALAPSSFSGGGLNTIMMVAALAIAGQQDAASTISLLYVCRTLGTIAGLSIMGSVIQKVLIAELSARIKGNRAQETIDLIRKNVSAISSLPAKERQAAIESYSRALQVFEIILTAICVVVIAAVMLVEERPLDGRSKQTKQDQDSTVGTTSPASADTDAGQTTE